jgi:hypothetical protein
MGDIGMLSLPGLKLLCRPRRRHEATFSGRCGADLRTVHEIKRRTIVL